MPNPELFEVNEETSGSYIATIKDDFGDLIPGSLLTSLKLTLYVVTEPGVEVVLNGRDHQNVLNLNNVTVYDALQTLADGRTYNLRWQFQVLDTTLEEELPYERHIALWEWEWPQGSGKHEVVLNVRNLTMIPV